MMACCTISPLNSPQKRNSSGIFDLPKSAKRRRPFTTTNITTASSSNINNNTTMYTTTSFTNNKPIIIDSKNDNSKSVFNSTVPYSPLDYPTTSSGSGMEFKNELMERIKYEAKRLNKRRQMNLSGITTTSSIIPDSTASNNTSSSSSSSNNNSDDDDQENTNTSNQPNKLKLLLNEMNNKKKLSTSSSSIISSLNTSSTKINLNKISDSTTSSNNIINNVHLTKTSDNTNAATTGEKSVNKKIDLLFNNSNYNDLPIFSMNQVNQICERMLKEREVTLREEYDKILSQKLNEQYDSFVRFTHEQIQRRFENSQCSYVS
jgi:hypothetical protein